MQHTTHDIFEADKIFSSSAFCRQVYTYFPTSHEDIMVKAADFMYTIPYPEPVVFQWQSSVPAT